MQVKTFVNPHRSSNTYVLFNKKTAVIIDLGNIESELVLEFLKQNKLNLKAVFLTHEHADHCCGVDNLAFHIDFELFCSKECNDNIRSPKFNYSKYLEEIEDFSIQKKAKIIYDSDGINFPDLPPIICHVTKGHSPGSMIYQMEDCFFTGDTLMLTRTPLSLPNSSKAMYVESLDKIKKIISSSPVIYPGHGDCFSSSQINWFG